MLSFLLVIYRCVFQRILALSHPQGSSCKTHSHANWQKIPEKSGYKHFNSIWIWMRVTCHLYGQLWLWSNTSWARFRRGDTENKGKDLACSIIDIFNKDVRDQSHKDNPEIEILLVCILWWEKRKFNLNFWCLLLDCCLVVFITEKKSPLSLYTEVVGFLNDYQWQAKKQDHILIESSAGIMTMLPLLSMNLI